jgi:hypothetical protein
VVALANVRRRLEAGERSKSGRWLKERGEVPRHHKIVLDLVPLVKGARVLVFPVSGPDNSRSSCKRALSTLGLFLLTQYA